MQVREECNIKRIQHVRIGEIRVATEGVLRASLGSCVAIGLVNKKTGVCGLAHCLLPTAPYGDESRDARYADRAVLNLLEAVQTVARERRFLRAFLVGGARVLPDEGSIPRLCVGELNIVAARSALEAQNLEYLELETGGFEACSVVFDCTTFEVEANRIVHEVKGRRRSK